MTESIAQRCYRLLEEEKALIARKNSMSEDEYDDAMDRLSETLNNTVDTMPDTKMDIIAQIDLLEKGEDNLIEHSDFKKLLHNIRKFLQDELDLAAFRELNEHGIVRGRTRNFG